MLFKATHIQPLLKSNSGIFIVYQAESLVYGLWLTEKKESDAEAGKSIFQQKDRQHHAFWRNEEYGQHKIEHDWDHTEQESQTSFDYRGLVDCSDRAFVFFGISHHAIVCTQQVKDHSILCVHRILEYQLTQLVRNGTVCQNLGQPVFVLCVRGFESEKCIKVLDRDQNEDSDEGYSETEDNLSVTFNVDAFHDLSGVLVQRLSDVKVAHICNKDSKLYSKEDLVNRVWAIIDSLETKKYYSEERK